MIPYGHQSISEDDINAVIETLRSPWLTTGPVVAEFEKQMAQYSGAQYGIACCNATAALHMACQALEIGCGDYVWTSPNTFVASANCALYCGAKVDFVDIDQCTYNMSAELLEEKLIEASKKNCLPKLVIPVHFAGQSCDMKKIKALSDQYGFYIVEDASHAVGGNYCDIKIGGCVYSDMTVFSFHPVKIITTGEGGMVLTNRKELAEKLRLYVTHGITRNTDLLENVNEGKWYYEQQALGHNYRITDLQCALGLSQLKRLDEFVGKRQAIAKRYNDALAKLPVILPFQSEDVYSAFHLYVIKLKLNEINKSRQAVFTALQDANIGVNVHYIPVHTQPYYKKLGFTIGNFPNAEAYYQAAISLPIYPDLGENNQQYVIDQLAKILV